MATRLSRRHHSSFLAPRRKVCPVYARLRMRDLRWQAPGTLGTPAAFARPAYAAGTAFAVAARGAYALALRHDVSLFEWMSVADRHSFGDCERRFSPIFSQQAAGPLLAQSKTAMAQAASDPRPSALLLDLLFQAGLKIRGLKAASAFEDSTNLSHMTFRRHGAIAFVRHAEAIRTFQREMWFPKQMRAWGASESEIVETLSSLEISGAASFTVFGMGFRAPEVSAHLTETAALLDRADVQLLERCSSGDVEGCLNELGPGSLLGPEYSQPLNVVGIDSLSEPAPVDGPGLLEWIRVRRAHMALSLLAAIDHEMSMWRERQVGDDEWKGLPRFTALLLEPRSHALQRQRPDDPIARLVDLVGSQAAYFESARWPAGPPSLIEMGRRVDASGDVDGLGEVFIKKLRSGDMNMTGRNFRTLVVSQFKGASKQLTFDPLAMASMLSPYLFAAHLLTELIPFDPRARRLDRTGWRSAYLAWWQRHAIALGRPAERVTDAVPLWLTGPVRWRT